MGNVFVQKKSERDHSYFHRVSGAEAREFGKILMPQIAKAIFIYQHHNRYNNNKAVQK